MQLRTILAAIASAALGSLLTTSGPAVAAVQRLSDFSCTGYQRVGSDIVLNTNGTTKVRVSFCGPAMVRVRVSPTGAFSPNPSPAVASPNQPMLLPKVADSPQTLVLKSSGLSLHIDKHHLRVDLYTADDKTLLRAEAPDDGTTWDDATGAISHSQVLTAGERLYGLGQDNSNGGTLDRRGTIREMWTGQQIRSGNVTADYPIPFYLSTGVNGHGYGCFIDNVWRLRFDLGKSRPDRLTWTAPGGPLDFYLINGPSFKSIINQYTQLTGRPSMLPLWAFGYWQSKCVYWNFEDTIKAETRFHDDGLPLDVIVLDNAWANVLMDYQWAPRWTDPPGHMANFHKNGHHVLIYSSPMVRRDAENYQSALDAGILATDGQGKPVTCGYYSGDLEDFTNPKFNAWLWPQIAKRYSDGIDGWFLDLIEPEGELPQTVYYAGKSADIHNTYPLRNLKSFYDFQKSIEPKSRPVLLGRAAGAGTQRYSGVLWTGDTNSDWATFQAHIPEAQNAGLSGLPWWTNDSGGFLSGFYKNDRYGAHARLYERWFEFTCFAPVARAHKAGPAEPFEYGPSVEATAKKYLTLRYRLMPYLYTHAHEAHATGTPLLRPLVLEYQNDSLAGEAKDEYLFGPDLLVAPVLKEDVYARPVYLPKGPWIGLEDGYEYTGGKTTAVAAPQNRLPLFVRAGAIIPMAPEMLSTGEKPWNPITLEIYPHGTSSANLYQDDGVSTDFEAGVQTVTAFQCVEVPGRSVTLTTAASNKRFAPKHWVARFHLTSGPKAVFVDDKRLRMGSWSFDTKTNVLEAAFADAGQPRHRVLVTLDGTSRPRPISPAVTLPPLDATGTPVPVKETVHIYPPTLLPAQIAAVNFDDGGEGLAYHLATPRTPAVRYRREPFGIIASTDAGGGYAITGLESGDYMNYTVDSGLGGWFTVTARVVLLGADGHLRLLLNRNDPIADFDIPALPNGTWTSVQSSMPFYLNPGEVTFTAQVMQGGFDFGNLVFQRAMSPPPTVEAEAGVISGNCGRDNNRGGYSGAGFVTNLGNRGTQLSVVLTPTAAGAQTVSLRYANESPTPAVLTVQVGGSVSVEVTLPSTSDLNHWATASFPCLMAAGPNLVVLHGDGRGAVNLDSLTVSPK